ncbi:MAG TPA: alcohol dehydrogenase catalytic domain-containing protein [Longimicrobium sp.]|nr:alcohol dehydrogenase catalytic domain-containing protein [Longimicrobium sp.]
MRAAIFHEHGGPEVVRVEDVPQPRPGPGEVLVQVKASAMNHLDLWVRRGLPIETTMPHIGGSDVAGVIAGVGEGVDAARVGERVVINPNLYDGTCEWCRRGEQPMCVNYRILGEHTNGGFAEYVTAAAAHACRLPDGYAFEDAAALPIAYMTAWRALHSRARLQPGEDVLVLGASGGTALAAVQIAVGIGARVFALTSGAGNVERLRSLGATFVYDRSANAEWAKAVLADTGKRGVDVVVESPGLATWKGSIRAMASGARLVTFGATTGPKVEIDIRALFWRQTSILGTTMASNAEFEQMLDAAFSGRLRPIIDSVMPLGDARKAHERMEAGQQFGKIVLVP